MYPNHGTDKHQKQRIIKCYNRITYVSGQATIRVSPQNHIDKIYRNIKSHKTKTTRKSCRPSGQTQPITVRQHFSAQTHFH